MSAKNDREPSPGGKYAGTSLMGEEEEEVLLVSPAPAESVDKSVASKKDKSKKSGKSKKNDDSMNGSVKSKRSRKSLEGGRSNSKKGFVPTPIPVVEEEKDDGS